MTALSEMTISLTDLFLNFNFLKIGMIAAGSVEASTAPSNTAVTIDIPRLKYKFKIYMTDEVRNAVIKSPRKDKENIFNKNFLKLLNGVSSPPEKRIKVAPSPTNTDRDS